jgi:hypothetical protein
MNDAPVLISGGRVVDPSRGLDATLDVLLEGGVVAKVDERIAAPQGRSPSTPPASSSPPGSSISTSTSASPASSGRRPSLRAPRPRRREASRPSAACRTRTRDRRRPDRVVRPEADPRDGARARPPDRRRLEGAEGPRARGDRPHEGGGDRRDLRRRPADRQRRSDAAGPRVRLHVRPARRRPRGGPEPRRGRPDERGLGLDSPRPPRLARGGRVDDGRPRRRAGGADGRPPPRRARLRARQPRRHPPGARREGAGELRGDAPPPDADRRGPRPLRLRHAVQDEPSAARRGRPPGARLGPGRRHDRLRRDRPRPAPRRREGDGVRGGPVRRHRPRDGALVLVDALVVPRLVSLSRLVEAMSTAPARLFGLPYGTLAEGAPADVVLFSTSRSTTFASFRSLSANSPWAGKTLRGRVERTFVGGREVHRHGAPPAGEPAG